MAIHGVSLAEREEVILKSDPGHPDNPEYKAAVEAGRTPEKPTKFFIGNMTKADKIELGDIGTSPTMRDGAITMENHRTKRAYTAVQRSLKGWDNFIINGKKVPFEEGTVATASGQLVAGASDGSMAKLPLDVVHELSDIILEKNGMTRQAEKNFASLLQPSAGASSETGAAANAQQSSSESEDAKPLQ